MKIKFLNADNLIDGIKNVSSTLNFVITNDNADLTITVNEVNDRVVSVTLDNNVATITYGDGKARFFRGLATLIGWINDNITKNSITETPTFEKNGAMLDFSRGLVFKVDMIKQMLNGMALMGLNLCQLYLEDTYEIDGYPYFGHARGRYTKKELKELDAYALSLGIELTLFIQTLGHMTHYLHWKAARIHKDTADALLAGSEETYKLIDAMFTTFAECFTTKRINIGMDETWTLGRGKYLDKFGYKNPRDIYLEHCKKVIELAEAKGLKPDMTGSMFFEFAGKDLKDYNVYDLRVNLTEEIKAKVPKNINPCFWFYYTNDYNFYAKNIDKFRYLFDKTPQFGSGVWLWSTHCPLYSRSFDYTYPALDACRDKGVKEVIATVWSTTWAQMILAMPGLAWHADYDYNGRYDEQSLKRCLRYACNVDYDALMLLELPEHPDGDKLSLSKALTYSDPLSGLADKHFEHLELKNYYVDVTKKLKANVTKNPLFKPAYDVILKLSSLLELKSDFGIRLKRAYDSKNIKELKQLKKQCNEIAKRLKKLRDSHYKSWIYYNKMQGWEIQDNRYGGLIFRFQTVKRQLSAYLSGKIKQIDELEDARLRIDGKGDSNEPPFFGEWILWESVRSYSTPHSF
jgi:hypothetical protein